MWLERIPKVKVNQPHPDSWRVTGRKAAAALVVVVVVVAVTPATGASEDEGEVAETLEGELRRWLERRRGCRCL